MVSLSATPLSVAPQVLRIVSQYLVILFNRSSTQSETANKSEMGGLSGAPLKPRALQVLKTLRAHVPASIPLIGCGGISTGADALDYARAGASLIQVYTGFGYDGVGTCRRIKDELAALLRAENTTWKAVVNESVRKLSWTKP